MNTDAPPPLARPAHQSRARKTSDAIIAAGLALLREHNFDEVSVAAIAQRAGVSVGGFYARFEGKEALLHALAAEVISDCYAALDHVFAPSRIARASIEGVVRAYVRVMVTKFREHRAAIVQIIRHARAGDPLHGLAVRDFNDRVHGRLRTLLQERRAFIGHPDPDFAVNIGLFLVSAAAREAVLGDALRAYPIQVTDDALIEELTRAYVAYLKPRAQKRRRAR
ncbi:MAG: TetR/AcrR family transcriptional regulator [Gemmatimonadota bacterium]